MRRATIRDVAADAGVSIGTASKALNGQGRLRPETRERVAEAARRLGFAPNPLAQALLAGRTYTVGMITTDSFGRFSIPVMLGAEDALGAGRISVFMCDTRDDPERERRYLDMLTGRRVDGLIVTGRRIEPRPAIGAGLGVPVVYAMTQPLGGDAPAVLPDDTGGGAAAGAHLLAAGRRHIAHITGPERFLAARKRAAGLAGALTAAGVPLAAGDVRYGEWSERWGREAAACCCGILPRPTRSSAAATRSPAGWGTRCAPPGGGYPMTSRSSASTTGSRWSWVPIRRCPAWTCAWRTSAGPRRRTSYRPSAASRPAACVRCRAGWWSARPAPAVRPRAGRRHGPAASPVPPLPEPMPEPSPRAAAAGPDARAAQPDPGSVDTAGAAGARPPAGLSGVSVRPTVGSRRD